MLVFLPFLGFGLWVSDVDCCFAPFASGGIGLWAFRV